VIPRYCLNFRIGRRNKRDKQAGNDDFPGQPLADPKPLRSPPFAFQPTDMTAELRHARVSIVPRFPSPLTKIELDLRLRKTLRAMIPANTLSFVKGGGRILIS
jgi:hypothetical protein